MGRVFAYRISQVVSSPIAFPEYLIFNLPAIILHTIHRCEFSFLSSLFFYFILPLLFHFSCVHRCVVDVRFYAISIGCIEPKEFIIKYDFCCSCCFHPTTKRGKSIIQYSWWKYGKILILKANAQIKNNLVVKRVYGTQIEQPYPLPMLNMNIQAAHIFSLDPFFDWLVNHLEMCRWISTTFAFVVPYQYFMNFLLLLESCIPFLEKGSVGGGGRRGK